jgi:hypothetical protein
VNYATTRFRKLRVPCHSSRPVNATSTVGRAEIDAVVNDGVDLWVRAYRVRS